MEQEKEDKEDLLDDSRERRRFEHRRKELKEIDWTKRANEWYRGCMIWETIQQEEERSDLFNELAEGSKRNEKLMEKLLKTLKTLNGEEEETDREGTEEKRSSDGGKEQRMKEMESREGATKKKREKTITAKLDKPPQPLRTTLADIEESWQREKQERRKTKERKQSTSHRRRNSA